MKKRVIKGHVGIGNTVTGEALVAASKSQESSALEVCERRERASRRV